MYLGCFTYLVPNEALELSEHGPAAIPHQKTHREHAVARYYLFTPQ